MTLWIFLALAAAVSLITLLLVKSRTCRDACDGCEGCEGCCEILWCPFECCPLHCATGWLPLLVIGVLALWGGGLAAAAWLVLSLVRS
jgi:hypothetical protein